MPDSSPTSRVSTALSPTQRSKAETFNLFLSELEDDLRKLREDGQPIRSLGQFSGVVKRSWSHACECPHQGAAQVTKVIRCEHGGYLVAMPDGLMRVDSQNPYGDWEQFVLVELEDGRVAIRSDHGRYLAVQADRSVRADAEGPDREAARFELEGHGSGGQLLATSEGKYLIAMPDGFLRADSQNPDGTWEQFEISDLQKAVGSQTAFVLDASMCRAVAFSKALSPCSGSGAERGLSRSSSTISI
jgi:hypothetical protein